jgi:hypothetical protein
MVWLGVRVDSELGGAPGADITRPGRWPAGLELSIDLIGATKQSTERQPSVSLVLLGVPVDPGRVAADEGTCLVGTV